MSPQLIHTCVYIYMHCNNSKQSNNSNTQDHNLSIECIQLYTAISTCVCVGVCVCVSPACPRITRGACGRTCGGTCGASLRSESLGGFSQTTGDQRGKKKSFVAVSCSIMLYKCEPTSACSTKGLERILQEHYRGTTEMPDRVMSMGIVASV